METPVKRGVVVAVVVVEVVEFLEVVEFVGDGLVKRKLRYETQREKASSQT